MAPNWPILIATFILTAAQLPESNPNPISRPSLGDIVRTGSTYTITWTPTAGEYVEIKLTNKDYGMNSKLSKMVYCRNRL